MFHKLVCQWGKTILLVILAIWFLSFKRMTLNSDKTGYIFLIALVNKSRPVQITPNKIKILGSRHWNPCLNFSFCSVGFWLGFWLELGLEKMTSEKLSSLTTLGYCNLLSHIVLQANCAQATKRPMTLGVWRICMFTWMCTILL